MSQFRWKLWTFFGVAVAVAVVVGICLPVLTAKAQTSGSANAADSPLDRMAVVNLDELVSKHPDAARLDEIEKIIVSVTAELEASPTNDRLADEARKQLDDLRTQLMKQFQASVQLVQAGLETRKSNVEAALKEEAEHLKLEMDAYQGQVRQRVRGSNGNRIDTPYMQDLLLVRSRNLAARRLELQRQMDERLATYKRTLEGERNRRLDESMHAHQAERLQIQLDQQTAADEEQRKKLQERLAALDQVEEERRTSLSKELGARYEARRADEQTVAAATLSKYQKRLDEDVRHQALGRHPGSAAPDIQSLKSEMAHKQTELKARFDARKTALMNELRHDSVTAQAGLKAKQKELQAKLEREKRRILQEIVKKTDKLSDEEKKRRAHLEEELVTLKAQRERVYANIVDQIRVDVAALARSEKVPLVLGGFRVNISCPDLTDKALKKVAGK